VTPGTLGCSPRWNAAEEWFEEEDPEGVVFEYEVLERKRPPTEAALPTWPSNARNRARWSSLSLYFFFMPDSR
jgi:hypothetical protein